MDPDSAPPGLRARVRWGNVARAAALAAAIALVAVWPRLRPEAPRVPAGAAVPVRQAPAEIPAQAPPARAAEQPPAAEARPQRKHRAQPRRTRRPRTAGKAQPAPAPQPPRPTPPQPAPWRPPQSAEFGVE